MPRTRHRTTHVRGAGRSSTRPTPGSDLADGMGDALAARPRGRRRGAAADRRARRRVAPEDRRGAGARARLPHLGRPRPLSRRGSPTRRVGNGAAVARRRGREPDARDRRRRVRVVLGGGADLLSRGSARRARVARDLAPPRDDPRRAGPIPRTSAASAHPSPSTSSAPGAERRRLASSPAASERSEPVARQERASWRARVSRLASRATSDQVRNAARG